MFWVPHPGRLACGISILSYTGKVRVGVRTDTAVVADPARIAQLFEQEFSESVRTGTAEGPGENRGATA